MLLPALYLRTPSSCHSRHALRSTLLLEGAWREMRLLIAQEHLEEVDLPSVIGHISRRNVDQHFADRGHRSRLEGLCERLIRHDAQDCGQLLRALDEFLLRCLRIGDGPAGKERDFPTAEEAGNIS